MPDAVLPDRAPTGSPLAGGPADWVDLDWSLVPAGHEAMAHVGAFAVPGFVRPAALGGFVADARALAAHAYRSGGLGTAYLGLPDPALPADHPRRWLGTYGVGAVAYDRFPADSPIRRLYEWDELRAFVAAVLGLPEVFPYADPFGALNLAVMGEGDELQWHFDQTDFVVSLALQPADEGGDFEASPFIRTEDDERYDAVGAVLAGGREGVVTIPMVPGTLLVFAGRSSLHRVAPISGPTPRLVALLAYDHQPGTTSSDTLKLVRYGRLP
ncbi:MAG: hypothetical protein ACKOBG_00160 [Actinomycetota bacterium]